MGMMPKTELSVFSYEVRYIHIKEAATIFLLHFPPHTYMRRKAGGAFSPCSMYVCTAMKGGGWGKFSLSFHPSMYCIDRLLFLTAKQSKASQLVKRVRKEKEGKEKRRRR